MIVLTESGLRKTGVSGQVRGTGDLILSKHRKHVECKTPGMHINWSARAVGSMLIKRESSGFTFARK